MKLKIRQHNASPREDNWSQMGGWLAELRDDNRTEPPGDGHAEPDGAGDPWPEAFAQADALAETRARAEARARSHAAARAQAEAHAQARALAQAEALALADVGADTTARAVIGDQLRVPIMWCELGS